MGQLEENSERSAKHGTNKNKLKLQRLFDDKDNIRE